MPKNVYHVEFVDGSSIEEWAYTWEQAQILAQAKQIEKNLDYAVKQVYFISTLKD